VDGFEKFEEINNNNENKPLQLININYCQLFLVDNFEEK